MKILLANPPTSHEHIPENPFLGLLYLASMARTKHDVWITDFDALKYDWPSIETRLTQEDPDVLGLTCTTLTYENMIKICRLAKKTIPRAKIVIGGPHVTAKPEESFKESGADFAVVGEGEIAFTEILENPELPGGIMRGKRIENLDDIPFPSRDLLEPPVNYYSGNMPRHASPETVMLWSRGCPHNCLFCSNPVYKNQKLRMRSPENILKELIELQNLGIKEIFVYDDELIGVSESQNKWLMEISSLIIQNDLSLSLKCQGRCSRFVSLDTLTEMKKAGFKTIMWGCESGSPAVLKTIRKGVSPEEIKRAIHLCKKTGIEAWMFLMVGNYRETPSDCRKTLRLVKKCKPDYVQATYATPYPSEYAQICAEKGYVINNNKSEWNTNVPVIETEYMSKEEMIACRETIINACKHLLPSGEKQPSIFTEYWNAFAQSLKNDSLAVTISKTIRCTAVSLTRLIRTGRIRPN